MSNPFHAGESKTKAPGSFRAVRLDANPCRADISHSMSLHRLTGALLTTTWLAVGACADGPLTLRDAYELALVQSEALQIGEAELRSAEARYRQATGGRWPELRAEAVADLRDEVSGDRESEEYGAGVGARWTIFQGFRTLRTVEARAAERDAAWLNQARLRELLYQDVADLFYQTVAQERELAVLADAKRALHERVAELERRVGLGRSRRAELLSAQVQTADLAITVEQARGARDAARELLAFLVGRAADSLDLRVGDPLPDQADLARVLEVPRTRADVAAAEKQAEAARLAARATAGDRQVKVTTDGNFYVWRDPDDEGDWDLVVRAEIPLFDRGARRAAVAEGLADAQARAWSLAELRRAADRDVRLAARAMESRLGQWVALQEALRVVRENYELQRGDYELGRSSNLDVLVALGQLYALQRQEAQLEMQVRAALVQVQVAVGGASP